MARLGIALSDEALEQVEEPLRAYYVKGPDGLHYPDLDVEALPHVRGLASTLKKFKEVEPDATKLAEKVQKWRELEKIDPAEYEKLKADAESRKGKETNWELRERELLRQKDEIQTDAQKRILAAEERATAERAATERYFLTSELNAALSRGKGRPHMILHELVQHVAIERGENGDMRLIVKGPGGGPRIKDSAGNHYSVDDLVAEYRQKPEWGGAFEPDGRSGSGAPANGGAGAGSGKTVRVENGTIRADPAKILDGSITVAHAQ